MNLTCASSGGSNAIDRRPKPSRQRQVTGDETPNYPPNHVRWAWLTPWLAQNSPAEIKVSVPFIRGRGPSQDERLIRQLHNIRQYMSYKVRNVLSHFAPMMGLHWRF